MLSGAALGLEIAILQLPMGRAMPRKGSRNGYRSGWLSIRAGRNRHIFLKRPQHGDSAVAVSFGRQRTNEGKSAKSVRKLHLGCSVGANKAVMELEIQRKSAIRKEDLAEHIPDASIGLNRREKTTLKAWFAARYSRPSFPDEFDRRLIRDARKAYDKLAKVFKGHADKLVSVYFDVDDEEREGPEDAYPLGISLVYNVERDRGKDAATSAAGEIKKIFQNEFCATGKWLNIELTYCDPVAETAFSIRAHRYFKKWHLDHLSLRNDDPVVVTSA
jgi:hypothetical protein